MGDSGTLCLRLGLIHCLLEGPGRCERGPEGIGGLLSKDGLEGPVGGALVSIIGVAFTGPGRSSFKALGPVGGAFPVADPISLVNAVLLGTEPKEGAAGATGGGETSLVDVGGS